ncbi:MAG: YbaN family protein [Paludibacteraceae bacterium]|nr:YbaN family protein [Paludibacteraceae bacterium]
MKKTILVIFGSISLVMGITGIFLPILPTTPFLLLAAALFARSSERLYVWLINHKIFGEYIRNFREDKAISLQAKIISISTLWLFMSYSIFFIVSHRWYLQALLASIALGVTIYILSFKTKVRKTSK